MTGSEDLIEVIECFSTAEAELARVRHLPAGANVNAVRHCPVPVGMAAATGKLGALPWVPARTRIRRTLAGVAPRACSIPEDLCLSIASTTRAELT